MQRRAVIDVGTNSVKLLVADISGKNVSAVHEDSEQTRLGRGFYETHILQSPAIAQTAEAVLKFAKEAEKLKATSIRVIATSAARDAKNAAELIASIQKSAGLKLEIISGEQEADWAFQGVTMNPEFAKHALLIFDVGGGSTEFIVGENGSCRFRESFNIGTVRLLEKLPHSDPPTGNELNQTRQFVLTFLRENVSEKLKAALKSCSDKQIQLVGTGGTTTILARIENQMNDYDRVIIESTHLSFEKIKALTKRLWNIPLAERQNIMGLPKKRADVMLYGVVICEAIMQEFGFAELRSSTMGLRFAAVASEKM